MIKAFLFFAVIWVLVMVGIESYRVATRKQTLSMVKLTAFGFATASVSMAIVLLIVVLF